MSRSVLHPALKQGASSLECADCMTAVGASSWVFFGLGDEAAQ